MAEGVCSGRVVVVVVTRMTIGHLGINIYGDNPYICGGVMVNGGRDERPRVNFARANHGDFFIGATAAGF
jgi:hypothetical protein